MFKEYDVVRSVIPLPEVPMGSIGTILIIHETGSEYVVEFVDSKTGKTLNVITVKENDLKKVEN